MQLSAIAQTIELADGRTITIETGKMARQAHGSAIVRMGNVVLMATVVSNYELREGMSFFPLSVDYQEKFSAAGRIPGGFLKREGRPSEHEILICRLVDRALRPLFPDNYFYETQVIINLFSADPEVMPDTLAALAASTALAVSDIPFAGPISEVRVARINGEFVVNPATSAMEEADINIIVAGTQENIMMVEGESQECAEDDLIEAIKIGHQAIIEQCEAQLELVKKCGGPKEVRDFIQIEEDAELLSEVESLTKDKIYKVASSGLSKPERKEQFTAIKEEMMAHFEAKEDIEEERLAMAKHYYHKIEKKTIRRMILDDKLRLDGRKLNEVRPLYMEVDMLPSPHGSALFTRGETQALCTVTLGSKADEKMLDKALGLEFSKFLLHYNFPPYCTGEAKPQRGTSRREVGHGNLAHRSLRQVLPEDSSYTIRIISDVLESNGSSSMATVCGGSLSLMDAGVPISGGVSGIAMGMISDEEGNYAILSDILGDEDHLGDMDFKVTGTSKGICACQMDIKIDGLAYETLTEALQQAKEGRLHILEQMNGIMSESREDYKPHAPRIEKLTIDQEFIGAVIGPGGKVIQELQRETNTEIHIEEVDGKGIVTIMSADKEGLEKAKSRVGMITSKPEVGETYEATVKSIMPYGAFVEIMPGKEGLLHISEISWKRLETMDGVFEVGDAIKVKLVDIDSRSGKMKLSRKALTPPPEGYVPPRERRRDDRGGDRRGGDRRGGDRRRDNRDRDNKRD